MKWLIKIINNRNFLLITSLVLGLTFDKGVDVLKPLVLPVLALVMVFSSTSFQFRVLKDWRFFLKATAIAFVLNFVVFGAVTLGLAKLLVPDQDLWLGFVAIAATPPGVAIIPFTVINKGDTNYAMVGVLGVYLLAIVISPLIIEVLAPQAGISPWDVIKIMLEIILLPVLLSRLLLLKKVFPVVQKVRGKVVNWGFALIIYTVVGLNRQAIFSDLGTVLRISLVFAVSIFAAGTMYELFFRRRIKREKRVVQNLMLTIKSSGFAAGTALALFGKQAALAPAIMAVFVVSYLIFTGVLFGKT